jgi:hypothetical protein
LSWDLQFLSMLAFLIRKALDTAERRFRVRSRRDPVACGECCRRSARRVHPAPRDSRSYKSLSCPLQAKSFCPQEVDERYDFNVACRANVGDFGRGVGFGPSLVCNHLDAGRADLRQADDEWVRS